MTWIPTSKDKKFGVGKIKISLKMVFCFVKKRPKSFDDQGCAKTESCYQLDCIEDSSLIRFKI